MMDVSALETFQKELESQLNKFETFLKGQLKHRTIRRHTMVIKTLIDFLCWDCGVSGYQEIRRGMVGSQFRQWYCSNMSDLTESQLNTSVKKFFSFLVFEQGISLGKDVLVGVKIKKATSQLSLSSSSSQLLPRRQNLLTTLSAWYLGQCDGDWEHDYGIKIETLDNPGWLVRIDLLGTDLEQKSFPTIAQGVDANNNPRSPKWIYCFVADNQFTGAGDPSQLEHIIGHFLKWTKG